VLQVRVRKKKNMMPCMFYLRKETKKWREYAESQKGRKRERDGKRGGVPDSKGLLTKNAKKSKLGAMKAHSWWIKNGSSV